MSIYLDESIKCFLKGKISPDDITSYIQKHFDNEASYIDSMWHLNGSTDNYIQYDDSHKFLVYMADINFMYKDKFMTLHYSYENVNELHDLEHYKKLGLEEMIRSEKTCLYSDPSDEMNSIMKNICFHFDGWFKESNKDFADIRSYKSTRNASHKKDVSDPEH